jgi:hypothetical protein
MEIYLKINNYLKDNNLYHVQDKHHIQMEDNVLNVNYLNILIMNLVYVKYVNKDTVLI